MFMLLYIYVSYVLSLSDIAGSLISFMQDLLTGAKSI